MNSSFKKVANTMIYIFPISNKLKAKWKVYRLVDRLLLSDKQIKISEKNPIIKRKVLECKKRRLPEKYLEIEEHVKKLVGNNSELIIDMLFSYFAYGYTPNEFLCYEFQNKTLAERQTFLSDRDSVRYAYRLNPLNDMPLFMDKAKTYQKFKKYYHRELFVFDKKTDYESLKRFLRNKRKIVKKNPLESCGRSVELLVNDDTDTSYKGLYDRLSNELKNVSHLVLEEVVTQHADMARYNSSSVNTVRCITLKNKSGEIIVPFCFMKIGKDGSFVDNGGAGGLLVGIDEKTGELNSDAVDETGKRHHIHPDTGVVFMGNHLPEWEKMIAICKEMASQSNTIQWIGWDMAYTDNGWIVIEGNGATELIGPQSTSGIGIRSKMNSLMVETKTIY